MSKALARMWINQPSTLQPFHALQAEVVKVVEVVSGLHNALSRMIDPHDPDSIESEWFTHSNELVRKLTGADISKVG